jgi:hypothetical protein
VHYYVGIYNHGVFYNRRVSADVSVSIELREGVDPPAPPTLRAELLDPFRSMKQLQELYSAKPGQEFAYDLPFPREAPANLVVNLFKDRLTLLRVYGTAGWHHYTSLTFGEKDPVQHVLTSKDQTPKTLFDFERLHETFPTVRVYSVESNVVWFAIFAYADGKSNITITSSDAPRADTTAIKHRDFMILLKTMAVFAFTILALYGCCKTYARQQRRFGDYTERAPLHYDRDSFAGGDTELLDPVTERQHFHRGGWGGDDGI